MYPDDLKYTAEHEWVRRVGDGVVRVGITSFAQDQLGDIVYVSLPGDGTEIQAGQSFGEVESTKSVSEIYAPIAGTVTARNEALDGQPELINADPYGDGWMVEITVADEGALSDLLDGLLDADAYRQTAESG